MDEGATEPFYVYRLFPALDKMSPDSLNKCKLRYCAEVQPGMFRIRVMSRIGGIINEMNNRTFIKERQINNRFIFVKQTTNNGSTDSEHVGFMFNLKKIILNNEEK